MEFDPYHKWLGIPRAEQPPHHYRLLGIAPFENDPDVIETAADQRMALLRTFQTGQYSALSQQLLNEVATVRLCLLTPDQKLAYDADLRQRMTEQRTIEPLVPPAQPAAPVFLTPVLPTPAPVFPAPSPVGDTESPEVVVIDRGPSPKRGQGGGRVGPAWLVFGAIFIAAAAFTGYLLLTKAGRLGEATAKAPNGAAEEVTGGQKADTEAATPDVDRPEITPSSADAMVRRFACEIPDRNRASWSIEGDELVQSAYLGNVNLYFGDRSWQDIDVSLEIMRTEGEDTAGVWFGHQDFWNTNYYQVGGFGNKWHTVHSVKEGKEEQLASRGGGIETGKWRRLGLRIRGKSGQCFLDSQQIFSFETARPPKGCIGLRTWNSRYRFRNITVKSSDGRLLLAGLPDLDSESPVKAYETAIAKSLAARGGALPTAADGRPLNLDFETGNLQDWTAEGDAFPGQPVKGDALHARYKYLRSWHAGQFWIGGNEQQRGPAKGSLTSRPFKVAQPYASFLLAGDRINVVELVRRDSNQTFFRARASGGDVLQPVAVDLHQHLGQEVFVRVVDQSTRPSGHVSFDDFRLHDAKPDLSPHYVSTSSGFGAGIDVLKLIDIERDCCAGQWQWDAGRRLAGLGERICRVPLAIPQEYDLAIAIEGAPTAEELNLTLPIGDRQVQVVLDGWGKATSGLRTVDHKDANANETSHRGRVLRDGQPNKLLCEVRAKSLKIVCNGDTVIDWRGDPARLSISAGIDALAGCDGLLIGAPGGGCRILQLELTPVTPASAGGSNQAAANASVASSPAGVEAAASDAKPAEGLRILEARWGTGRRSVDVAATMQAQIKEGRYRGTASPASFGGIDPDRGFVKTLTVRYSLGELTFKRTFRENELVALGPDDSAGPADTGKPAEHRPPQRSLQDLAAADRPAALTAKEVVLPKQHTAAVTRVAFHRTRPILASAGKDGQVLLWDLQSGGLPLQVHKFAEEVWTVKFHPALDLLAYANRRWWGSRLYVKTLAGVQVGEPIKDFKDPGGEVWTIAYSHDARLLAAGQVDGTIRLWDLERASEFAPVGLGGGQNVYNLAFGPVTRDAKRQITGYLLAEGGEDGEVRTLSASLVKIKSGSQWVFRTTDVKFDKSAVVLGLRFSSDGKLLGATRRNGNVSLYDPSRGGQPLRVLAQGRGSAEWIAFHPQQPWCVTAHREEQATRIWHTGASELLCELKSPGAGVLCAEFSPDGRQVATAHEDFSIRLWELAGAGVPPGGKKNKKGKPVLPIVGD